MVDNITLSSSPGLNLPTSSSLNVQPKNDFSLVSFAITSPSLFLMAYLGLKK